MAQAEEARRRLCDAHGWQERDVELVPVLASGDKVQDRPLAEIGGKALWTKELDAWLAEGLIDAAVHSMKDVETIRPASLAVGAVLPRADVRDVLIGASTIADLPPGARIGTSSPRRAAQMLHLRPDCSIVSFRGNVATRLEKLARGDADATLLAAAGLVRLGETKLGSALDAADWLPAPAQGAIGIECNTDDEEVIALLSAIDHAPSRQHVFHERALLEALGGNCHSPVGMLSQGAGEFTLRAAIFSADGAERIEGEVTFSAEDRSGPARLAEDLLSRSPPQIRQLFAGKR